MVLGLIIFPLGCATVSGPSVSWEEVERAREELRVKALDYQLKQLSRVANIGYKLVLNLPKEGSGRYYPFTGLIAASIDKYAKRLFNLNRDEGIVAVAVVDGSPAQKTGLRPGDVILSADGKAFGRNVMGFLSYIEKAPVYKPIEFNVERQHANLAYAVMPVAVPINVHFQMIDMPEVNAAATPNNYILYTYGMVKFAESDDEIAVVLAHELAHLNRGHVAKMQGAEILSSLLAVILGSVAESQSAGSGQAVMQGTQDISSVFSSRYSRELENEADYFGILYAHNAGFNAEAGVRVWERFAIEIPQSMISNFLSTHPSSPERMLRIEKIIQELKQAKK